ncbi:hypothetical protein LguiA_025590 [Lonicera macranthoides]
MEGIRNQRNTISKRLKILYMYIQDRRNQKETESNRMDRPDKTESKYMVPLPATMSSSCPFESGTKISSGTNKDVAQC